MVQHRLDLAILLRTTVPLGCALRATPARSQILERADRSNADYDRQGLGSFPLIFILPALVQRVNHRLSAPDNPLAHSTAPV